MHGCCRTRPNWHIGKPIINNCIGLLIWSNKRSLTNNHHACNTANVCLETNVPILNMHEVHYMQCISYCKSLRKALYRESFTALPQVGAASPGYFLEEGGIQVGLHHLGWRREFWGEGWGVAVSSADEGWGQLCMEVHGSDDGMLALRT